MQRRFLRVYCDSLLDDWLSSLTDEEYATYWKINKLIHLNTSDGSAEFTWDSFTALIGKAKQNERVLKLLEKFHQEQRILWVNREEFIRKNVPVEVQQKLGIRPCPGASSEQGSHYSVNQWSKGGKILEKIVCFSPKLLKYYDSSVYRKKRENNNDISIKESRDTTPSVLQQNLSNTPCPQCGEPLTVKKSKYGEFVSCSRFPKCKYRRAIKDDDCREHCKNDSSLSLVEREDRGERLSPKQKEIARVIRDARKRLAEK
jgi:hypothetical protein